MGTRNNNMFDEAFGDFISSKFNAEDWLRQVYIDDSGYDWVFPYDPDRNRTREEYPYSYSDHFIWRTGEVYSCDNMYSDRMAQDREKWNRAFDAMGDNNYFREYGHEDCERFLEAYLGYKVVVYGFSEGCNVDNGHPYWIFWFRNVETS